VDEFFETSGGVLEAVKGGEEGEILPNRQLGVYHALVRDYAELRLGFIRVPSETVSVKADRAGIRMQEAGDYSQQRGLARAVNSAQAHRLGPTYVQIYLVEGPSACKGLAHRPDCYSSAESLLFIFTHNPCNTKARRTPIVSPY